MKKKAITILIISLITLFASSVTAVFAYFYISAESDKQPTITVGETNNDYVITVSTETDFLYYVKDGTYNGKDAVSILANANRITVTLGADITLKRNVFVTADVHIDLNGHTLDLNGFDLSYQHTYSGAFALSGGTIDSYDVDGNGGTIYLEIPNATVITENLTYLDAAGASTATSCISVVDINAKYVSYNLMYFVSAALSGECDELYDRLSFGGADNLAVTESNGIYTFTEDMFLVGQVADGLNCAWSEGGVFTFACSDLDLPENYFGFKNIDLKYVSSNESISEKGNVTALQDSVTEVTLTAKVFIDGIQVSRCDFTVYVVKGESYLAKVGEHMLLQYISEYYSQENSAYSLNGDIVLPTAFTEYGVSFEYKAYNLENETDVFLENAISSVGDGSYTCVLMPLLSLKKLGYIVTCGATVLSETKLPFVYSFSETVETNYAYAQALLKSWFGSSVLVTAANDGVNGYTTLTLVPTWTSPGGVVNGVSYELVGNEDNVYEIVNNVLQVQSGKTPSVFDNVSLNVTIEIDADSSVNGEAASVTVALPVRFVEDDEGNNIASFLPYYTYFNNLLKVRTNGLATADSFYMPFSYSTGSPIICFGLSSANSAAKGAITIKLAYDSGGSTVFVSMVPDGSGNVCPTSLDNWLTANSMSLSDLIAANARWYFEIDKSSVPNTDNDISLTYYYKGGVNSQNWTLYSNAGGTAVSFDWTLLGLLQSTDMPSTVLYGWVYNNYNSFSDTFVSIAGGDYIYVDWLYQDKTFNNASSAIGSISSYKGMEFLDGIRKVYLSNGGVSDSDVQYFAGMDNLQYLDLSNNSLSNSISSYFTSTSFPSLVTLNISNNGINSFNFIEYLIDTADTIYVNDNIASGSDALLYGSLGFYNMNSYITLLNEGIIVYCEYVDGNYLTLENCSANAVYVSLKSVALVKKLPTSSSIATVYSGLSTTKTDYIDNTTPISADRSYTGSSLTGSMAWGYVLDTGETVYTATTVKLTFTITRVSSTNTSNLSITVYYKVDRI